MSLIKRRNGFLSDIPSIYDNLIGKDLFDFGNSAQGTLPSVNVKDNKEEYVLEVAAPGLKKDDFHIEIHHNLLTVSSEKKQSKEEKDDNFTRKEFHYSSFKRTFSLPDTIKGDEIKAGYNDGILEITIPKKTEVIKEGGRKIEIE
ncbi:Hsp20/alpha crystallin family protein [Aureibacter tunicatorum]|uniref:HSP20 family protein n=1 Tax=Aureibacter tunicatorum TaxID=866807 RepID=A0AAE3XMV2_9BACT|nr:Hsp20/alpha crystallin family protein [Aureibacter tunicatorum]MDR6237934.1 HSP20 family protein [Aureibacter tunicatorum]BDD02967.1 heat-shock protein [Aureibacter tunicatorum]